MDTKQILDSLDEMLECIDTLEREIGFQDRETPNFTNDIIKDELDKILSYEEEIKRCSQRAILTMKLYEKKIEFCKAKKELMGMQMDINDLGIRIDE